METHEKPAIVARVAVKLGDDVSTDAIYPGRFMATVLPEETPQYAFADDPDLNVRLRNGMIPPGSIVRAGSNFGCGSSREQAASALKGYGLVVIADSFGRIFLQNAVNLGLQVLICPALQVCEGDEIEIADDRVINRATGKLYPIQPLPAARRAIIEAGGLIPYARERVRRKLS